MSLIDDIEIISDVNDAVDDSTYFLEHTVYLPCRTIPVNWVNVTSMSAFALKEINILFSAEFMTMREMLSASHAQDVLNNTVCPIIKDVAPILTLTKWLIANNKESMHEHAAFLRCLCMLMSIDPDVYDYDPIKYIDTPGKTWCG